MNKITLLSELLRPENIDQFIGHKNITGENSILLSQIRNKNMVSSIFWGPPGCGKTTLARIICNMSNYEFYQLSAVSATLQQVRKIMDYSKNSLLQVFLFLDEIHRFNKTQQDALLPSVESGDIILLGATTENPAFGIIPALRSRMRIIKFETLTSEDIEEGLNRGIHVLEKKHNCKIEKGKTLDHISLYCSGDLRKGLNILQTLFESTPLKKNICTFTLKKVYEITQSNFIKYDKAGDEHYDHASAFQKSIRGSDVNGALYWLGKMLEGGEDPAFIGRRLVITASEDVGMADPMGLLIAEAALRTVKSIGMPEAKIPLSQAVIYLSTAPKSNSSILSINKVLNTIRSGESYSVPIHLKDNHYKMADEFGFGKGYSKTSKNIQFLPDKLKNKVFYKPDSTLEFEKYRSNKNVNFEVCEKIYKWLINNNISKIQTDQISADLNISKEDAYNSLIYLEKTNKIKITKWAEIEILEK
jgi:putative ATPase